MAIYLCRRQTGGCHVIGVCLSVSLSVILSGNTITQKLLNDFHETLWDYGLLSGEGSVVFWSCSDSEWQRFWIVAIMYRTETTGTIEQEQHMVVPSGIYS